MTPPQSGTGRQDPLTLDSIPSTRYSSAGRREHPSSVKHCDNEVHSTRDSKRHRPESYVSQDTTQVPTTFMRVQNIHGLPSSVEAISCSLADTPINFLPDIIVLTETNCVDADLIEFAGYRKLDPIPAIRGPQGGRPSAGMLILVKDTYDGPLQRIETKETRQSICCAAIALGCPKRAPFQLQQWCSMSLPPRTTSCYNISPTWQPASQQWRGEATVSSLSATRTLI